MEAFDDYVMQVIITEPIWFFIILPVPALPKETSIDDWLFSQASFLFLMLVDKFKGTIEKKKDLV